MDIKEISTELFKYIQEESIKIPEKFADILKKADINVD